jgi:RNA polymerase sigma factor (sigma-70 family)
VSHIAGALVRERIADLHNEASRERRWKADDAIEPMVAAAQRGDQSAWSALIARLRRRMLGVARSHGLGAHQADDVAQETCVRLYRGLSSVRDPRALDAWVVTTARRESLRALKTGQREHLTDQEVSVGAVALEDDDALLHERRDALTQALAGLPPGHRRLMEELMADPEPSYAEVAERLGIPVGSIGPTRGRCVARLRAALAAQEG